MRECKTINDHFVSRLFRTQVISYHFGYFVPIFIFNLVILYPVLPLPVLVSYLHLLEYESFRPLSRSPLSHFEHFPFHPRIVSSTFHSPLCRFAHFPVPSRVDSPLYKFCFELLIGVKLVLFEILSYKQ